MHNNIRDRKLLDLAYQYPCMLQLPGICEGGNGEPAHSNQPKHGKGGAMKAHDLFHVPACRPCHIAFDQGIGMSRDERRDLFDFAHARYIAQLWQDGHIGRLK